VATPKVYDWTELTNQFVVGQYLAGTGNTLTIDAVSYMTTGAGRYANLSQLQIIKDFFDGSFLPSTGTQITVNLANTDVRRFWGIQQFEYGVGSTDFDNRAFIHGNTGFALSRDAVFVVTANGERYIQNSAILANTGDFDFRSQSTLTTLGNLFLEPKIDPKSKGKTVDFAFDSNDLLARKTYTYNDYVSDQKAESVNHTGTLKGIWQMEKDLNSFVFDALSSNSSSTSSTPYLTIPGVVYTDPHTAILQKGGTIDAIVRYENQKNNNNITSQDILAINGITWANVNKLPVGTQLLIPVKDGSSLLINAGDVHLNLNSNNGTYTYVIADPRFNTTTTYQRSLDSATGKYTDNFTKIDNATGVPIEKNVNLAVDSSYGSNFDLGLPTTSIFNLNTNTSASATTSPTSGEIPVNANDSTLRNDGISLVNGVGNVNLDSGFWAVVNDYISDGFRPGNHNLSTNQLLGLGMGPLNTDSFVTQVQMNANAINNASAGLPKFIPIDPLVLDLNGDGVKLTNYIDAPVLFDIDHDSGATKEQTGWVSAQDGIVVYDRNSNDKIDDISETLSEYFNGAVGTNGSGGTKPYANGLAALKSLDSNSDNQFTSADTAWENVKVWVDVNHDGITDAGELKTLSSLNITSINLNQTAQSGLVRDGNEILASSTFIQNGQTKEALAANFIANPNGSTFATSGTGILTTTEGNVKSYTAGNGGEIVDVAQKGVNNAQGGTGNDTLIGDSTNNWLAGNLGADTINAGAGDDVILFDSLDTIDGGDGTDIAQIVGDAGVTLNLAQSHIEVAVGGRGGDVIIGGGRSSVFVKGGEGDDILIGGAANDVLSGEDGDDLIDGGAGNDLIRGHRGQDLLMGGAGDDILEGGQGDDSLSGGDGNDVLNGGQGDDTIDGGAGNDIVQFTGSYADYRITKVSANGQTTYRITDTLGRDGTDTITNVEKLSFKDVSWIDPDAAAPMPVKDILDNDANGVGFDRTAAHLISKAQLLGNDIDRQGDVLHITTVSDFQGGIASITPSGDVLFTPDASYKGVMGFKYSVADAFNNQTQVKDVSTGQTAAMKAAVYLRSSDIPHDPLIADQWYLSEANIIPVWQDYTGKGVRIGQFEPGSEFATTKEILDVTHYDLKSNLNASWLADPTPGRMAGEGSAGAYSNHATLVAGVMVAANNGEGGIGVAYGATIGAHWIANNLSDISAMGRYINYDVVNNSWGASQPYAVRFGQTMYSGDYINAVQYGRSGLGTVMVLAGGNDRQTGGSANTDNFGNNRYGIQVGSINSKSDLGTLQVGGVPFSNPGASLLISAPGSNITSTSRLIESDNGSTFGNDESVTQGTSFATPIVSGIVALMLEANPDLGYRDVQEILAMSAKKVIDTNTVWADNHATNWNGGAMHTSLDYGFGEVDALAAVRLAETWTTRQTAANENSLTKSSGTLNQAITDNGTITSTINMGAGISIEHVEVDINYTHQRWGDLIITLVAPNGTESILANRVGKAPGSSASDLGNTQSGNLQFTFMTTRDWGELSAGNWTLKVTDAATGSTGTLNSWSLRVYGKQVDIDDTFVYTDEYATIAGRNTLSDTDGGLDTINASAVTGNTTINLTTGAATLKGKALTISSPGNFENVFTGDGNDTVVGNAANNLLDAGRGSNTLTGNAGKDIFVVRSRANGVDTITDFAFASGEKVILVGFEGKSFSNLGFNQSGADTIANLGNGQTIIFKNTTVGNINSSSLFTFQDVFVAPDGYVDSSALPATPGGVLTGTNGNDTLNGSSASEVISGGQGNDTLRGGGGDDVLDGGAGDDYLYGDDGNDIIYLDGDSSGMSITGNGVTFTDALATGGLGNDRFVIRQTVTTQLSNIISDFDINNPNEKIDLSQLGIYSFSQLALSQWSFNNTKMAVVKLPAGGTLAALVGYTVEQITPSIFIFATPNGGVPSTSPNDPATAGVTTSGNTLTGDAGGNTLNGGVGAQVMSGRTGDDTYIVDNVGDVVNELPDGGYDAVQSSVTYTLSDNVELLTLTGASAINGTGNSAANRIVGNSANNILDGQAGSDDLVGGLGNDTYIVDVGTDRITENANEGIDTVQSSVSWALGQNLENLTLTGVDHINATGNTLSNVLIGNIGNNTLDGAQGADTMQGGAGDDTYFIDNIEDVVTENLNEGIDTVYTSVNLGRNLDANVENIILFGNASTATGNDLDNMLIGNDLSNTLNGGNGNDYLDGGLGTDTLVGGAGDDVYLVDTTTDTITEAANGGIDTVQSSVTYILGTSSNLENLTLTGTAAIDGTGNTLDNVLIGNSANNTLTGGGGNDTLDGGAGIDTLIGGDGNDTYIVDGTTDTITETSTGGTDTVQSSVSYTLGATSNLENLTLTGSTAINGTGNALNNVISGNSGANILDGGSGTDTLVGGDGDDTYIIDNVSDTITETATGGVDTAQSSVTYTLGTSSNVENLTLTGAAAINGTGNALDNTLIGNSANNTLTGGAGNDTLDGGAGIDILVGGDGNDLYIIDTDTDTISETATGGIDTVQSSVTYTLGASSNLENLTLTGTVAINGTGNALSNVIRGNSGANVLDGGAGADSLVGGDGDDTYVIDNAADTISETATGGIDTVQSGVTYTLGASSNLENLTLTGTTAINGTGNALDNVLTGNSANNTLTGGAGNDTLNGGAGIDTLIGGDGNDTYIVDSATDTITETSSGGTDTVQSSVTFTLGSFAENLTLTGTSNLSGFGNSLNNVITGNSGGNTLNGFGGVDTLIGGAGDDVYIVDTISDTIVENLNQGVDTVRSDVSYVLGANLENLILAGSGAINGTGNSLSNAITGNGFANILDGGAGTDYLSGGDGNDTYIVDSTTDTIVETATGGVDTVQSSVTYILGASSNLENLTLTGTATINGTGNSLDNVLTGNSASNTLNGGIGNDTLIGDAGNDVYLLDAGFGQDLIIDTDNTTGNIDTIRFGTGVNYANTQVSRNGNSLILTVGSNVATVQNWFSSAANQIEQIKFVDHPTVVWDVSTIRTMTNTAPTAASATLTTNEDTVKVFAISDFGFSDGDAGDMLQSVTITTLPTAGSLKLNGVAVTANQVITAANISSGLLAFTPVANANGTSYASIGFKVSDGTTLSASAYALTMNVTAVNDAPTATNLAASEIYTKNVGLNLKDIVITDVDSTTHTVTLTLSNVAAGSLNTATSGGVTSTYNVSTGVWSASGVTANVNALLAGLTFTPSANYAGSFTITTSVSDGIAPAITGTKNFSLFGTAAPTITNINASEVYTEDISLNLVDMVITDSDSTTHTATLTLSNIAAGTLNTATSGSVTSTYNPSTGVWAASGSTASVNALLAGLTFTPAANYNGNFTIATSVSDGLTTVIGSKSFTGIAVNDAPKLSNFSAFDFYTENVPLNLQDFVITDVDSTQLKVSVSLGSSYDGSLSAQPYQGVSTTFSPDWQMWEAVGSVESLNGWLAGLTFLPNTQYKDQFSISITVSNPIGYGPTTVVSQTIVSTAIADKFIFGTPYDDLLEGVEGFYAALGGAGNDVINGGDGGGYYLAGEAGNDILTGGDGNDSLDGGDGDDYLYGGDGIDALQGGAGSDHLNGGDGDDTYYVDTTSDVIVETSTGGTDLIFSTVSLSLESYSNVEYLFLDTFSDAVNATGNALSNFLLGTVFDNTLTDLAGGNDILQGYYGDDILNDTIGNNLLDGGDGADVITAGSGSDIIIGSTGDDVISTGIGSDVILFNQGDGSDIVNASVGTDNTLSLGGNFSYSDLSLTKSLNDLILKVGASDQITLKGWYDTAANNKSILNLQVIAETMQGFNLGGSDVLRNNKIETFNFANLVSAFDAAGSIANWQLTDARLSAHLSSGSDTVAIGGDIAFVYGHDGGLNSLGVTSAQNVLNTSTVGQTPQTFSDPVTWNDAGWNLFTS